jgi:hypothetical protein
MTEAVTARENFSPDRVNDGGSSILGEFRHMRTGTALKLTANMK